MIRALPLALLATPAFAGDVSVAAVDVRAAGANAFRFDVTLRHADTGWEHYANAWRVELEDGTVLDTRVLAHPHVDEQPFTRSKTITVPAGTRRVRVRGVDSVHGPGEAFWVELPPQ